MIPVGLVPHEFSIGGVFVPPLLVAGLLALIATGVAAHLLNRFRISRYFFYPPLVYVALLVIFTVLCSTFLIPS